MPISRDKVVAELEVRKINYKSDMEYKELAALLEEAKAKEAEKKEPEVPTIPCGVRTINDHEKRLFNLEQKVIPDLLKQIEELKSA